MMGNKKLQVWLPLLFSIILIIGMFLGYGMNKGSHNDFFASNHRSSLQEAMDIIRLKYVDSVSADSLEGRAIEEMMAGLDPHSVYLPPVDLKEANEDLAGNFQGIGVEFNIFSDTINIVYVITGGPSDRAGLRIGDKIVAVDDHPLTTKGLTVDDIKALIRGAGGSTSKFRIVRQGTTLTVPVTRGTIPVPSVDAAYMIDATTAYIKLNKFTETSYEEFMQAMETLQKQGMKKLIFDLRGNGGGFMNEAVDMADEFLDGEKLVVYTQGVNSRKREYRCKRPGLFEKGKLILLVDELSASATEILAGALQDWCRATIVGRRTFGKGLVQEQYPLNDGGALRLTVARYYTPLGRSIQRSYAKGKKIYMDDLWARFSSGEMFSIDSIRSHNTGQRFVNNCNDTLYGGDGITPDVFVPADTTIYRQKVNALIAGNSLNAAVYSYYMQHPQVLETYATAGDYAAHFDASGLWEMFSASMADSVHVLQFLPVEKEYLQRRLKALLARYRWRNAGFYEVLNAADPALKAALAIKD